MVAVESTTRHRVDAMDSEQNGTGSAVTGCISIRLNGETRRIPSGATVADLLQMLEIQGDRIAVEVNRSIVRRPDWNGAVIEPDSAVELVQFVGGG